MKLIYKLSAAAACTFMILPAATVLADDAAPAAAVTPSLPTPPKGKGMVVLYRPSGMGMAIVCHPREDGKMVAKAGNGKYSYFVVEPRKHKYTVETEAKNEINIEVDPDDTYYIRCKITMGIMAGRPRLSLSTKAEFDQAFPHLKLEDMNKMAEDIAKDSAPKQ
jgi:hypothetical protein